MSVRTARYQGGSIVSFIIIAVLITAAVGIGLHVLRQRSEQLRIGQATSQDMPPELPGSATTDNDKKNATDAENFPSSTKDSVDEEKTAGTSSTTDTKGASSNGSTSPSSTTSPSATALPETGPEQLLIIPVLAAVVYVATAYAGSSRTLARLR